jgi:hypothetical protein
LRLPPVSTPSLFILFFFLSSSSLWSPDNNYLLTFLPEHTAHTAHTHITYFTQA